MTKLEKSGVSSLYTRKFCGSIVDRSKEKEEHIELKHREGKSPSN